MGLMGEFVKILVGLDLSAEDNSITEGSRRAADEALALAPIEGATVTLFHSGAADEHWSETSGRYVYLEEGLRSDGRKALDEVREEFRDQGIEATLVTSVEHADVAILHHVAQQGIDLVITGKRGARSADGRRLGSVSMKLLRHCPCAVWVVKAGVHGLPRNILVASDLGPVGTRAVGTAARLAQECDAELHVVHAYQVPMSIQMEGGEARDTWDHDVRERARESIHAQLREAGADERSTVHVGLTSPTAAILEASERIQPDLAILGSVARTGIPGFLVGNTAERILGRLDCSLLVIKPPEAAS